MLSIVAIIKVFKIRILTLKLKLHEPVTVDGTTRYNHYYIRIIFTFLCRKGKHYSHIVSAILYIAYGCAIGLHWRGTWVLYLRFMNLFLQIKFNEYITISNT